MSRHSPPDKPIRILLAKPGLDGHDRGAKVLALGLRDAGFEVLYTGIHRKCEDIVTMAIQEDVDVIGVSMLSGGHLAALTSIMSLLKTGDAQDILVVAGGFLPDQDEIRALKALGVLAVFDTDTRIEDVVSFLRDAVKAARTEQAGLDRASCAPGPLR